MGVRTSKIDTKQVGRLTSVVTRSLHQVNQFEFDFGLDQCVEAGKKLTSCVTTDYTLLRVDCELNNITNYVLQI